MYLLLSFSYFFGICVYIDHYLKYRFLVVTSQVIATDLTATWEIITTTVRFFCRKPVPQVTEQSVHADQEDMIQFTGGPVMALTAAVPGAGGRSPSSKASGGKHQLGIS